MGIFEQNWSGAEHSNLGHGTNKSEKWKSFKNGFYDEIFLFSNEIKISDEN